MSTNRTMNPTEPAFYANHTLDQLEAIIRNSAAHGQAVAAQYGADHPLAEEHAAIWAAATFAITLAERRAAT